MAEPNSSAELFGFGRTLVSVNKKYVIDTLSVNKKYLTDTPHGNFFLVMKK